ncbi:MAG: TIGR01212 family radical SAM protein [Fusobacterium sp.]|nr:TIGR01212 family radical SAM protein [Fusobacterium sp.]
MQNRFYSLNDFFKEKFGEKIYKVSLDAGFTCPNRDGKISYGGCTFCSENGSGEFTGSKIKSITEQIDEQIEFLSKKFKGNKFIAYFQNFTNTYGDVEYLEKIYMEALNHKNIIGLAIATRPDCLDEKILNLLNKINKKTFLWLELGLQTLNDEVADYFNRGYKTEIYEEITKQLNILNIKFVTHIIIGLAKEKEKDFLETALLAVKNKTWGLKVHIMYVVKNTRIEKLYLSGMIKNISKDEYTDKVIEILENIPDNIVVHRLTGDGETETLISPLWTLKKIDVLNTIQKKLKARNTYQGKKFKGEC